MVKTFFKGYLFGVALTVVLFILAGHAHCAISTKHDNAIGSLQYFDNPNTYKVGGIVGMFYVGQGNETALVVRVQPLSTYGLFTEDIAFCGSESMRKFVGKSGPQVLTYLTKASRIVDGVGCHTLVRVDEMKRGELQ